MAIEIKINDVLVHTITDAQVTILKDKFPLNSAELEITSRIIAGVNREISTIKEKLIQEWYPHKLAENGVATVSTNPDALLEAIFSQTGDVTHIYKDRDARDAENSN